MHCFRRFRSAVLKKNRCPDDLAKFWLGHQNRDITDDYAEQLREDVEWRQQMAAAVGMGFSLPAADLYQQSKMPGQEAVEISA